MPVAAAGWLLGVKGAERWGARGLQPGERGAQQVVRTWPGLMGLPVSGASGRVCAFMHHAASMHAACAGIAATLQA